jgi:glycosyltransferase involved in cell wall biosynthesis
MSKKKICLISDTHNAQDDRIYWKEAVSLQKAGYDVTHLCVGKIEKQYKTDENIIIHQIKRKHLSKNRYLNFLLKTLLQRNSNQYLFNAAKTIQADVYHIHDLKPLAIIQKLKKFPWKPRIIYCIRESHPDMIRDYNTSKGLLRLYYLLYASYINVWEKKQCKHADFIITIDDAAYNEFMPITGSERINIIYNYSNLFPTENNETKIDALYDVIYIGGITKLRGLLNILRAIKICKSKGLSLKFALLGKFYSADFQEEFFNYVQSNTLIENIEFLGWVPHKQVCHYLTLSKIGIVTLLPIEKYKKNIPIKQFEYMAFGLPVIGSNLPPIEDFIKPVNAGLVVDPEDPESIAEALINLISDIDLYSELSKNGMHAARNIYNWIQRRKNCWIFIIG